MKREKIKRLRSSAAEELRYYSPVLSWGIIGQKIFALLVNQESRENHIGEFTMTAATEARAQQITVDDHPGVGAQINDHSAYLYGVQADLFFTDADIFTQAQLLVTDYYKLDTVSNFWDVYNVEAEALGQKIVYYPDGLPDIDRTQRLLSRPSDLDRLRPPNPYKSGRMPWIHKINRNFLEATGKLDRAYFTAPFSLAANIRGYEGLVEDMLMRPAFSCLFR